MSQLTSLGQSPGGQTHDLSLGFGYKRPSQASSRTSTNEAYSERGAGSRRTVLSDGGVSYAGGYSWDAGGRLTRYDEGLNALALRPGYDAEGRRTSLGYVVSGNTVSAATYGYDFMSRLTALGQQLAGTADDQSFGFGYNPASQIATRTSSNQRYASTSAYDVDRPYAANGLNQYSAAGPATFTYDANGNLQSDGATTYTYDAENRLVSAASAAGTVTLSYDPLGRLWQVARGGTATRFLYDGDDLIQERDGSGTLLRAYVHAPGSGDEPLMWYEYTNGFSRRFLHANHQGSIVGVSDSSGTALATTGYDAWGIPNELATDVPMLGFGAGRIGRFGYTGQAWIPELGMYHYKARVYSPTLGRFLQTDPVGYDDQINLYAYVGNDPVNSVDPTGMDTVVCNISVNGNAYSGTCRVTADSSDTTRVTYNITRAYTDAYGRNHITRDVRTQSFSGSISREGVISRVLFGVGHQIRLSVDRAVSVLVGRDVSLLAQSGGVRAGYSPTPPAASPIWQGLQSYRGARKTDGENYYEYDRKHGEIEVYNRRGEHLGTQNAITGAWEKGPVPGRRIEL